MPFIFDDIFLRMLGLSVPPFDMIWIVEQIKDRAYSEMYDIKKINDGIKENRMLFELGDIANEEYEERNNMLNHHLKIAQRVNNMNLDKRIDIL